MKYQTRHACPDCGGHGRVRVLHDEDSPDGGYWTVEPCPGSCAGSGFIIKTRHDLESPPVDRP